MFCTSCGTENPPAGRFCTQCGAVLPLPPGVGPAPVPVDATGVFSTAVADDADAEFSPSAHQGEIDALAPGSALLVVRRGPNAGSRFLLDRDITTAGRHPDSDIFLDDVTVSRRHVEFRRDQAAGSQGFTVHDVGSLNGTYVNRERIDSSPLAGGDEVQIGKFRLVYLAPAGQSAAGDGPAS